MKVLIVGGGMGGCAAIVGVRKSLPDVGIVLVEPKDFMEVIWANFRSPFDDEVARGASFPLAPFCQKNNVKHVRSTVTKLTKTEAILADGNVITFDAAVIASGAKIPWLGMGNGLPEGYDGSLQGRLRVLKQIGDEVMASKNVVIVGGGLIGSEVAGDIAVYGKAQNKDIKVTLVQSQNQLCSELREKSRLMVQKKLTNVGVHVILNEKAIEKEDGTLVLASTGTELQADYIIKTVGLVAVNNFVEIEGALTEERGFLNTDDCFRVNGGDNRVFAFGDCCITGRNAGAYIFDNIKIIGHNVKTALQGKDFKTETSGPEMYVVTTGPNDGVFQGICCSTQYVLPPMKNKNMFLFRVKGVLGFQ